MRLTDRPRTALDPHPVTLQDHTTLLTILSTGQPELPPAAPPKAMHHHHANP